MASTIEVEQLGRDIRLPETPDEALRVTPTGDIASVEGRANVRSALRRRLATAPGELVHRPGYGAGLLDALEGPNRPAERALLANRVRRNVLRDPRVSECTARVSAGLGGERPDETRLRVELAVTWRHQRGAEIFSLDFGE